MLRRLSACALLLALGALLGFSQTEEQVAQRYRDLLGAVRLSELRRHYETVATFGDRLAGSEGEAKALSYAQSEFSKLGLKNIHRESFPVTAPDPRAFGTITLEGGGSALVYPMWPNLVRTSTCDISGPIIYGGKGSYDELDRKDLKGSIVVLDFDSGDSWKRCATLGAGAVVFVGSSRAMRSAAEQKLSSVPVRMPRFWLPLADADPVLLSAMRSARARLQCRQNWIESSSGWVSAQLPGEDPTAAAEEIVVFAYADSMSIVPGINPGAESSSGVAAAIELARVWSGQHPRRRPITFVVSGSHCLALQGARQWVEQRINSNQPGSLLVMTLDLTSGSRTLGSFARGHFFDYRWEAIVRVRNMSRILRTQADRLAAMIHAPAERLVLSDATNDSDGRSWKNNIPGTFAFDCEPMIQAGMNSLTFATTEDSRDRIDTPEDTLDRVNLANIERQVQTLAVLMHHVLNDTSAKGDASPFRVSLEVTAPVRNNLTGGFCTLEGDVVRFDPNQSFVPDVPVIGSLAVLMKQRPTFMGVRGPYVQKTRGDRAHYKFVGAIPVHAYPPDQPKLTWLSAFQLDQASGDIVESPSFGVLSGAFDAYFKLKTTYRSAPVTVFPCVATDLYDLTDPQDLKVLQMFDLLDAANDSPPRDYGFFLTWSPDSANVPVEDCAVLFTSPEQKYKLLMRTWVGELRLLLVNATPQFPNGIGYTAPKAVDDPNGAGAERVFPFLALHAAKDLWQVNQARIDQFAKYRIVSAGIGDLQQQAHSAIEDSEKAIAERRWGDAQRSARTAWGYVLRAHPVVQTTANDVVNGVLFYLFLLIPFSYFMERLLFAYRMLTRQLAASAGIFMLSFLLLRAIHPAFEIVANPFMIFVGFVMGVLSLIVGSFIVGKFEMSLRVLKASRTGVHEVDAKRGSIAAAAFNLGIGNLRRRKARTALTTLTLVVMTFIVLSFTSIVPELRFTEYAGDVEASYAGILVRGPGLEPLQQVTYRMIETEFRNRATVARRAWYYGADIKDVGAFTIKRAEQIVEPRAMIGLDPEEAQVTHLQDALLPGGRWFQPGDCDVMILPESIASDLKIDPKSVGTATVRFAGADYKVIGIINASVLRSRLDLDGESLLPADFSMSRQLQSESQSISNAFRKFIRLDPAQCFLVPAERAIGHGADIRSVAVSFAEPKEARKALNSLLPRLRMNLYAATPGPNGLQVSQFSAMQGAKGVGIGLVIVQMLIASIFVLNTMIASVYERTREIGIFSAVGLAPNHIATLFFAESLVYGVLGAVFGYLLSQIVAKILVVTNALPGLYLNFSSTSAVASAAIVMAIVLISTIYPAKIASRIAAPSLDQLAATTIPEGDDWEVPLPFRIPDAEAAPIATFLTEWLMAYEEYTIGSFVASDTKMTVIAESEREAFEVNTRTWLAPYDLGVSQHVSLRIRPSEYAGVYEISLHLHRIAGDPENWVTVNRRFEHDLRKQILTWRVLLPEQRARYVAATHEPAPSTPA